MKYPITRKPHLFTKVAATALWMAVVAAIGMADIVKAAFEVETSYEKSQVVRTDAAPDTVVIEVVGSQLKYETTELKAKAGTKLAIKFVNKGSMPHNVVIVKSRKDIDPVGIAGMRARKNEYIPKSEKDRILGYSSLAKPNEESTFVITVPPPGKYPYVCTFPGHFRSMQGVLISVE